MVNKRLNRKTKLILLKELNYEKPIKQPIVYIRLAKFSDCDPDKIREEIKNLKGWLV